MISRTIAYTKGQNVLGAYSDIFTLSPDETETQITSGAGQVEPYDSVSPDWSSDGNWLVFTSTRNDPAPVNKKTDIYKVEVADPSNISPLTNTPYSEEPSWSRANSQVVFISNRGTHPYLIYEMDSSGQNENILIFVPEECIHPKWSVDGTKIAFAQSAGNHVFEVTIADYPNVMNTFALATGQRDWAPEISPDGTKVVFSRMELPVTDFTRELYVIDIDGTNIDRLTTSQPGVTNDHPTWRPDGALIAFDSDRDGGGSQIFEIDPVTKVVAKATDNANYNYQAPVYIP